MTLDIKEMQYYAWLSLTLLWVQSHQYFIGWALIEAQPKHQRIEGTFRWFEDEVDQAMFRTYHRHLQLQDASFTDISQADLKNYWLAHVQLYGNQQKLQPTIKRIERNDQVVVFYVTWPLPPKIQHLQLSNNALMEVQSQQEHLIQCKILDWSDSATLSLNHTQHTFTP